MIICFNCEKPTKLTLDQLVAKGGYENYAEAISVAVQNLAVIHQETGRGTQLIVPSKSDDDITAGREDAISNDDDEPESLTVPAQPATKPQDHEQLLHAINSQVTDEMVAPADLIEEPRSYGAEEWAFGQLNKILPAKVSCRILGHMVIANRGPVDLSQSATEIARIAMQLGDRLSDIDAVRKSHRDDTWATAFPVGKSDPVKGRMRYANQFVGYISKTGDISGLPVALRLFGRLDSKSSNVSLTKWGWDFAKLSNPILDGDTSTPTAKLSEEEIRFLLDHIRSDVPWEDQAYMTLIRAIEAGEDTPNKLDKVTRSAVNSLEEGITDAYLSTQRSGAISRMSDLDLVTRRRKGVHVQYDITDRGRQYMSASTSK